MGLLVPILAEETLPGDVWHLSHSQVVRFAPMVTPVMHKVSVYVHYFFVPNRLIWDNWQDFITGGEDGTAEPLHPVFRELGDQIGEGRLPDYMGLPTDMPARNVNFNALPFAAYFKIWNEYYRDQNLQDKLVDECEDGVQSDASFRLFMAAEPLPRAWEHDYFTSALPFTQKGPQVTIPLGNEAPIVFETDDNPTIARSPTSSIPISPAQDLVIGTTPGGSLEGDGAGNPKVALDVSGQHIADLSNASGALIIDLRNSVALQNWLEMNARGGSRYTESNQVHWDVKTSDARLQRPEYIGGTATPVTFSEVLQTSANASQPTPQGNMAGHGVSVGAGRKLKKYTEEHGWIIGIMSIRPKTAYQQGIPRKFKRETKFSYPWPVFQHIGEQEIANEELYVTLDADADANPFGFVPRYAEWKYIPCTVHGSFRTTLDDWHMGRIFDSAPVLNETFIQCNPTTRIFAATDTALENMYVYLWNDIKVKRKLAYYGNPKMM